MKIAALRVVLGDQLSRGIAALEGLNPETDIVMLAEVMGECTYVPHHRQKIILVLSAMRHFAEALRARGVRVRYVKLDDPANSGTIPGEVARAVDELSPARVIATAPGEYRVRRAMEDWADEIREDHRFLATTGEFAAWAAGKTQLRMEFFYREMRRKYRILLHGDQPVGGKWNFDSENRKRPPADIKPPKPLRFPPDAITNEVTQLVRTTFPDHYGDIEAFGFPVTAQQASAAAADFFAHRLGQFGEWQDAMLPDQPFMFHSLLSAALNLGLLEPLALCQAAEVAYHEGTAPLNAVEGFIRQILGWREYIRGIYWLHMPEYAARNSLNAHRKIPEFYWTGQTDMACMKDAIGQTMRYAYAHHIQRLMITGNFALLAGLDPAQIDEWYLAVYADAYEWVEMPNTRGMALHADGGIVGSKPYAASGAYINRMSHYCTNCHYDVSEATTSRACPFNALYWDFIARHAERFAQNPRMAMPARNWAKMPAEKQLALQGRAATLLHRLEQGEKI